MTMGNMEDWAMESRRTGAREAGGLGQGGQDNWVKRSRRTWARRSRGWAGGSRQTGTWGAVTKPLGIRVPGNG